MARPKTEKHSSDVSAEIRRLEGEKQRLIQVEDTRRGAIIRDLLSRGNSDSLRSALQPLIGPRDAFLFDLAAVGIDTERSNGTIRRKAKLRTASADGATVESP